MKHTTQALTAMIVTALCAVFVTGFAQASTIPLEKQEITYQAVRDLPEPEPEGMTRILAWQQEREEAQQAQREAEQAAIEAEAEYADYSEDYGYYSGSQPSYDSPDGFRSQGVRAGVDSDTETWYSSASAYHYRTAEWSVDDEGYYRDSDGYYVVASDDYSQGEVVNTSKGEAKVYDNGTYSGNIDMYVAW